MVVDRWRARAGSASEHHHRSWYSRMSKLTDFRHTSSKRMQKRIRGFMKSAERRQKVQRVAKTGPEILWNQTATRTAYESQNIQIVVALLIVANFVISAIQAQRLFEVDSRGYDVLEDIEEAFAYIFLVELLWNMYGSFFVLFWKSAWNWFDFIVVVSSLLSIAIKRQQGVGVLRLLRAFRAIRLFKRIDTLRHMIESIIAALPGVGHAFMVSLVLMGIWSIMGVEFFAKVLPQEFGSFSRAMFTMWTIMTLEGWVEIANDLIYKHDMPLSSAFFISYIFIVSIVMSNVVVAILLDKYLETIQNLRKETEEKERKKLAFTVALNRFIGAPLSKRPRIGSAPSVLSETGEVAVRKMLRNVKRDGPKISSVPKNDNRRDIMASILAVEMSPKKLEGLPDQDLASVYSVVQAMINDDEAQPSSPDAAEYASSLLDLLAKGSKAASGSGRPVAATKTERINDDDL